VADQIHCQLWSERFYFVSDEASRGYGDDFRGRSGQRRRRESAVAGLAGELIEDASWLALPDWVDRSLRRAEFPAPGALLSKQMPASPPLTELRAIRQDLGRLNPLELEPHSRAASHELTAFLDRAIEHATNCENDPDQVSVTRFILRSQA
jgi:hypothetical protein